MHLYFAYLKKKTEEKGVAKKDNHYTNYAKFVYFYFSYKTKMNYHQRQTFTQDSTHVISFIEPDLQLSQVIRFYFTDKTII